MNELDRDKLVKQLIKHEGVRFSAYQDTEGYWTIGIGRLIDERKGGKISLDTVYQMLDEDINEKIAQLDDHIPWWKELDGVRQIVLANMCFNLGIQGLLGFENTLECIRRGNYEEASAKMLQSKWSKQVGKRAIELSQMMRDGV
jgi:lysozyme